MTEKGFIKRLKAGKSVDYIYKKRDVDGLVASWKYEDKYILTWEECPPGEQNNENLYAKDDRHEFLDCHEVIEFIKSNGMKIEDFTP